MGDEPDSLGGTLQQALFERRIVMIGGHVGDDKATEVAAALMTLDALGDEPIEIRLNAHSDSLEVAFSLIDTIDALGVAINATVTGAVSGTMVGPVAVCRKRLIGASGRIELREPHAGYDGSASHIERQAEAFDSLWHRYLHRLAEACGQPFEHLEADHRARRYLDPSQAVAYGLIDEIINPPAKPVAGPR